jgi:Pentapeptide repeats (8 copies)
VTSRQLPWRKGLAWSGLAIAAAVVVVAAVYVIFWPVSDLIARHDVGAITGRGYGAALQAARDAARGRLVAFGAGLFAAGALIYTARNFSLARQGQVTDRYTKAIEQLGSDKGLDVRIGAIYALERIARDSATDHPTVMEVLAAFVREHSREQREPSADNQPGVVPAERMISPDVQAAVTVIGRRNAKHDRQPVNLSGAVLAFVNLNKANLHGAALTLVDLTAANIWWADLTGTDLADANLTGVDLTGTDLTGAKLNNTKLTGAILTGADLTGGKLTGADLTDAKLNNAKLNGADLTGAKLNDTLLTGANLTRADLTGANIFHRRNMAIGPMACSWLATRCPLGPIEASAGR